MYLQISSGVGPAECQRVVKLLYDKLKVEFPSLEIVDFEAGDQKECWRSVLAECSLEKDQNELKSGWEGTVQWRGRSPFRPNHSRQNWFVKVSLIEPVNSESFDLNQIRFEAFRGGGPGGQHVNKNSTAVRAVYQPTGEAVTCSNQRSQFQNKQVALVKLKAIIDSRSADKHARADADNRLLHYHLERGNPVKKLQGSLK